MQSLPSYTATSAVLLLLGALPIEGEIHRRQLSLLYGILQSDSSIVKGILDRQSTVYSNDQESFCGKISEILDLYQLPPLEQLYNNLPTKEVWKTTVKKCSLQALDHYPVL